MTVSKLLGWVVVKIVTTNYQTLLCCEMLQEGVWSFMGGGGDGGWVGRCSILLPNFIRSLWNKTFDMSQGGFGILLCRLLWNKTFDVSQGVVLFI